MLKGAHVYSPGLLAVTPGMQQGDLVAVSAALDLPGRWGGIGGVNRYLCLPHNACQLRLAATGALEQRACHVIHNSYAGASH